MLDRIGITATSLCALHCILLPVLLPTLSLMGFTFLADHTWEHVFLIFTAILGSVAIFSGFKRYHRKIYPFIILFLGVIIYWIKHDFSESLEVYFIVVGAALIIAAHIINLKLCNNHKQCTSDKCIDEQCNSIL